MSHEYSQTVAGPDLHDAMCAMCTTVNKCELGTKMPAPHKPIWQLVEDCARELTSRGFIPFSRSDLIECVKRKNPACPENSINPVIQGITDNLRGGAPGAERKNILHSVGRGQFIFKGAVTQEGTSLLLQEKKQPAFSDAELQKPRSTVAPNIGNASSEKSGALSEDEVKKALVGWLQEDGWDVNVAWGNTPGIDIDARRGSERWIIEAKGCGSRDAMRVNYFLAILGETLQRMNDPNARYYIALPDIQQFRRLWQRLPALAKSRTAIGALFVDSAGHVQLDEGMSSVNAEDAVNGPASSNMKKLEAAFHREMLGIFDAALAECDYSPTRFRQMVAERGGLQTAIDLLRSRVYPEGLTELWKCGRLDLSVEALVLKEPWRKLFQDDELGVAGKRLNELGYDSHFKL